MTANLRRSALYVPGDSEKMLQKSVAVPSDILLLNLEDGVASSQKSIARENIANALLGEDFGDHEIVVRINPLNTEAGQSDLAKIVPLQPDGICVPKVESVSEIQAADNAILELEKSGGLAEGKIHLHAMIESAKGVLRAPEIAAASSRMSSLIFGSADYASDIRCQPGEGRIEILFALQMIVTAARAAGISAIDAPCFDIRNHDLLQRESNVARHLGYDGKSALHPGQLTIINQVFDVTSEEIAWAEKILSELDKAEDRGRALTTIDGKLVDNPHRAAAERILGRKRSQ